MEFLPNKILLKIAHFFGCLKDTEHITDVTVNIDPDKYDMAAMTDLLWGHSRPTVTSKVKRVLLCEKIKEEILEMFKSNNKLEMRCRKVKQIWITFYTQEQLDYNKDLGSQMRRLIYKGGVLYFEGYKPDYEIHKELYPENTND